KFGTTMTTSATMYVEFILRALGYSSTAQTDISDALSRARAAGILIAGECAQLQSTPFLRADVAYLSYYALEVPLAGSGTTLQQKLSSAGVFTADAYRAARALVTSARLW
ncbi:MAG: S-layer homology domain-containing protein, partial [Oscillospiraceae bacterium]|nr:S-layer homology domain-containing protein [Oscillospiraceae bacterium]